MLSQSILLIARKMCEIRNQYFTLFTTSACHERYLVTKGGVMRHRDAVIDHLIIRMSVNQHQT
jgi:hypothetical protein